MMMPPDGSKNHLTCGQLGNAKMYLASTKIFLKSLLDVQISSEMQYDVFKQHSSVSLNLLPMIFFSMYRFNMPFQITI